MRIEGTKRFAASRERVWDALVDPELLADFLPGMQSLEVADEAHWSAVMRMPLAPVSLTLHFELRERARPDHALLHAEGKRLRASAQVQTSFDLTGDGDATEMAWAAEVRLGGVLGRTESLLRPLAQQQAERFLERLDQRLSATPR